MLVRKNLSLQIPGEVTGECPDCFPNSVCQLMRW